MAPLSPIDCRRKERWHDRRTHRLARAEVLPIPYFHVVFTLPHGLNALAQWCNGLVRAGSVGAPSALNREGDAPRQPDRFGLS